MWSVILVPFAGKEILTCSPLKNAEFYSYLFFEFLMVFKILLFDRVQVMDACLRCQSETKVRLYYCICVGYTHVCC